MITPCGKEQCQGKKCGNFGEHGCKGVDWSIPPWCMAEFAEQISKIVNERQEEWRKNK